MIKIIPFVLLLSSSLPALAGTPCTCKCITKNEEGQIGLVYGTGKDREAAGVDLRKNLLKRKCELTPDCTGQCNVQ